MFSAEITAFFQGDVDEHFSNGWSTIRYGDSPNAALYKVMRALEGLMFDHDLELDTHTVDIKEVA